MNKVQAYIKLCENLDLSWDPTPGTWVIDKFTKQARLIYGYDPEKDRILLAHPHGEAANCYTNTKDNLVPLYDRGYIIGPKWLSQLCKEAGVEDLAQREENRND